ncbi:hypothetical protein KIPB_004234 [Kipferlia bialata]|uniref:Uncharacterized protein n=1 Tax=Kipferlia bialata TaxID=797122 RepID=A0A9K3GHZ5_9EUKA|nr:hypothetical protein KIPB_004234 [Kipferlia bialata]|eukprot:g4234.t1
MSVGIRTEAATLQRRLSDIDGEQRQLVRTAAMLEEALKAKGEATKPKAKRGREWMQWGIGVAGVILGVAIGFAVRRHSHR